MEDTTASLLGVRSSKKVLPPHGSWVIEGRYVLVICDNSADVAELILLRTRIAM